MLARVTFKSKLNPASLDSRTQSCRRLPREQGVRLIGSLLSSCSWSPVTCPNRHSSGVVFVRFNEPKPLVSGTGDFGEDVRGPGVAAMLALVGSFANQARDDFANAFDMRPTCARQSEIATGYASSFVIPPTTCTVPSAMPPSCMTRSANKSL